MKVIIGIGNPGKRYEKTRHNVGFEVLDLLEKRPLPEGIELVKPETFVNRTGEEVLKWVRRRGVQPGDVLIICDDVNLDFGKIRIRPAGSAGGHHGLESVIESLDSDAFPRLRIGVRTEKMPRDLTEFVLGPFEDSEKKRLASLLDRAAGVSECWARDGFEAAQKELSRLQSTNEKE